MKFTLNNSTGLSFIERQSLFSVSKEVLLCTHDYIRKYVVPLLTLGILDLSFLWSGLNLSNMVGVVRHTSKLTASSSSCRPEESVLSTVLQHT